MRTKFLLTLLLTFSFIFIPGLTQAEQTKKTETINGEVSLPWDKFQNVLQGKEKEITLDLSEFLLIIRQTGTKEMPQFTTKEGQVILKREEFSKLLKEMKPPKEDMPDAFKEYLITSGDYDVKVRQTSTLINAKFQVEILPRGKKKGYILIPILAQHLALHKMLVNGMPALIAEKDSHHAVALQKEGKYSIEAEFSIAGDIKKGPQTINFPVPKTPITLFDIEIPLESIKPEITGATAVKRTSKGKVTFVNAILSPTQNINVAWSRIIPEAEKGPARVYGDIYQLLSIEDDALKVKATASMNVLQNTITEVVFKLPSTYQILNVTGSYVGDWREKDVDENKVLNVSLKSPRTGRFDININAEKILSEDTVVASFDGFSLLGAVREKGFIAVEMRSSAEAKVQESKGLDHVSFEELPGQLVNQSQKPIIFAYKYLRHPYNMILDIQKHKKIPVISTVIDQASGVTLFTEDGKIVHQITYTVRNTWKQFMELSLPKDSELWAAFVDKEPVKPSESKEGKLMIPLNRSQNMEDGLTPFTVEIIYFEKANKFRWFGKRKTTFPVPDLVISNVMWSVYLPFDYSFIHFGGTMEKEKIAQGLRPLFGIGKRNLDYSILSKEAAQHAPKPSDEMDYDEEEAYEKKREAGVMKMLRSKSGLRSDFGKNIVMKDQAQAKQLDMEMNFSQRLGEVQSGSGQGGMGDDSGMGTGVMPIRISIPTTGQVYRFAKQLVSKEDLTATTTFISDTPFMIIKLIILILILYIAYLNRKYVIGIYERIKKSYESNIKKHVSPKSIALFLFIFWLFSLTILRISFITKLTFFFLFLSIIYLAYSYLRDRKKKKSG